MSGSLMYSWLQIPTATVPVIQKPSIHRRRIKIMFKLWEKQSTFYTNFHIFYYTGFLSHSRIFHSYGDVTIAGEGLQNLTYTRHSWLLNSERSLGCHTYWDTGTSVYNGHLRRPVTLAGYKISSFPNLLGICRKLLLRIYSIHACFLLNT